MTRRLELEPAERATLEQAVRHHPKPYARERAAALVKVADRTAAASWVAEHGLLTAHAPDTVYRWLDRYEAEGLAALTVRPGRGRKPTLSPPGAPRAGGAAGGAASGAGERPA
jgi:Winged helix-turn helix